MADRVRYMYLECPDPECQYSCVLAITPAERGKVFCCHICFDLSGILVDMPMREATAKDLPTGVDQRFGEPR